MLLNKYIISRIEKGLVYERFTSLDEWLQSSLDENGTFEVSMETEIMTVLTCIPNIGQMLTVYWAVPHW